MSFPSVRSIGPADPDLEASPDVHPWTQYGQVEGWEQPFRGDAIMLLLSTATLGLAASIAIMISLYTRDWEVARVPVIMFVVFVVLGVLAILSSTRTMRHSLLRTVPTDRGATVIALDRALTRHGVLYVKRSQVRTIRPPGRKFDEVFSLMGASVWIGVGPPWFAEDKGQTQLVMGPAKKENENRIAKLAWTLDEDLHALGFVPLASQSRLAWGGGGFTHRAGRSRAGRGPASLGRRPWRSLTEADGWVRASARLPRALRIAFYVLFTGLFILTLFHDIMRPIAALSSVYAVLLGTIACLAVLRHLQGREAGNYIVRRVGLPPEAVASAIEAALREAGHEPHELGHAHRPSLPDGPCTAAYRAGPTDVRVSGRILGRFGEPKVECDVFMGHLTTETEQALMGLAWHIERRLRAPGKKGAGAPLPPLPAPGTSIARPGPAGPQTEWEEMGRSSP